MNRSLRRRHDTAFTAVLFAVALLAPAAVAARQAPPAWLGISLECSNCRLIQTSGRVTADRMSARVAGGDRWEFSSPPRILAVEEGSPAARAGLLPGDVLTHIDGVRLATDDGSHRLADVAPGQTVQWTYERAGQRRNATMIVEARPVPAPPAARPAPAPATADRPPVVTPAPPAPTAARDNTIRFSGEFAGTEVTVRGPATTVVRLVERQCRLEIHTADTVIRLSAPGKCDTAPADVSERSGSSERRAPASSPTSAK